MCVGSARHLINWDVWPLDCWLTSGGTHSCWLDSLTVVFFTVLLHGDLHLSLGSFTMRFTICGKKMRGKWRVKLNSKFHLAVYKIPPKTCYRIMSSGSHWMWSLASHYLCPQGLKDAFMEPLWTGLKLTQILLCLSTHSYYTPPNYSTPACSLVSVLACIV